MILCLGPSPTVQRTMTFSTLQLDSVNRAASVYEFASGKSTNAARVIHELGEEVTALGFAGGERGSFFRSDLDRSGIAHDFVEVAPLTRLCITVVDQAAGTATELLEESHQVEAADYDLLLEKLAQHLAKAKMLILSGTLPPGANSDFYARCIELAQPKVPVILDAVGEPLAQALGKKPLVIKPNRAEVGRTLGINVESDQALRDGMRQLVSRGAQWVVVTQGKLSTLVTDGRSFWEISSPSVKVVSPIGSGDAFAAGLAVGLVRGDDVPHACILATACGAANAMTPDAGHLSLAGVNELKNIVRLKTL